MNKKRCLLDGLNKKKNKTVNWFQITAIVRSNILDVFFEFLGFQTVVKWTMHGYTLKVMYSKKATSNKM